MHPSKWALSGHKKSISTHPTCMPYRRFLFAACMISDYDAIATSIEIWVLLSRVLVSKQIGLLDDTLLLISRTTTFLACSIYLTTQYLWRAYSSCVLPYSLFRSSVEYITKSNCFIPRVHHCGIFFILVFVFELLHGYMPYIPHKSQMRTWILVNHFKILSFMINHIK